ncbi:nuclear transport factor 2 family protein [Dyadobacter sp. CY261]|uniref:nuclear transport factor 2 family protein n=1 Tax=Dyadobacter sp. CY261 TaxID=2907203 RepID=UPI001F3ABB29|nr:nuclear transport factor 2 family protein [Dyadobacter sp. CY261]MCF0074261.1 nuclear transport factor 2 family protein [Dyadobacter sp. CY261]
MKSERAILNLIAKYTHFLDQGEFGKVGQLFARGTLITSFNSPKGKEQVEKHLTDNLQVYPDGTLRTSHVTTNIVLDIDEQAGIATSVSYLTIFQQNPDKHFPLQAILTGRYHDQFRITGGEWYFESRELTITLIGDISHHAKAGSSEAQTADDN